MPIVGPSARDDAVFFISGLILLTVFVGVLRIVISRKFLLQVWTALQAMMGTLRPCRAAPEDEVGRVVQAKLQQQTVDIFRRSCHVACVGGIPFTAVLMLNIATREPRMYSLTQDAIHLSGHGILALIWHYPGIISWRTISLFHFMFVVALAVWSSPFACHPDVIMTAIIFGNILIIILTMMRRSLPAVAWTNLAYVIATSCLIWRAKELGLIKHVWPAIFLECVVVLLVTSIVHFVESGTQALIRQSVEMNVTREMLSAASALLRSYCDVVVQLDASGCITSLGKDLGGFLLRGPDYRLQGRPLSELMSQEDSRKFLDKLGEPKSVGLAEAMHVRMKDGNDELLQLELFLFQFCHLDNQPHYLVGLREFSDVGVCRCRGQQQCGIVPSSSEQMATPANDGRPSLPEMAPVITGWQEESPAVVDLDCSQEGFPINECSPGFALRFGRVVPNTRFVGLVKSRREFENWVQDSLNRLAFGDDDAPTLQITLNMPQGPIKAVCKLVPESSVEAEDAEEERVVPDMENVRIMFVKIQQHHSQSRVTNDTKGTPSSHLSL